ncbi:ketopantoate reductase family protein [Anaerocolumna sp.]|uniref:ketopantoate reductase family protein n=1 Tax=Anaerocolumna sp. TaxID=2041569 RepID=UPI0028A8E2BA|nr:2-dehydropantoate 2-reductase N-terminal domain-containing protein [Anaerocolumna sp.]
MKFLIYGAGVIGSIFAGKLYSGDHDITMLARNKRFEELKKNGLKIKDIEDNVIEQYNIKVIEKLEPEDVYDFILVTLKFGQVEEILPLLSANKSKNIIFFINNPLGYDKWRSYLGERLMIGFPACGGEIKSNITEYYISKGITKVFQTTTFGEIDGSKTKRLKEIKNIFTKSGIPSAISKNMDNWQKCHIAVVTPIANAIYKQNGDIKALADNKMDIKVMIKATREGLCAVKELGYKVEPIKLNFYFLPIPFLAFCFGKVLKTKIADFSMAKHSNNAKDEMFELQKAFEILIKDTKLNKEHIEILSKYIRC